MSEIHILADVERFKVAAAIALGHSDVPSITTATGIPRREVEKAIARLAGADLIEGHSGAWRVRFEQLARLGREHGERRAQEDPGPEGADDVVRRFVRGGRLTSIPGVHTKRLAVLDHLAQEFEPGRIYPERDVNEILGRFHDDFASLRRYMVDEGFFERSEGKYWRSGGTFPVD